MYRHLRHQGEVVRSLLSALLPPKGRTARPALPSSATNTGAPERPSGQIIERVLPARAKDMVRDYVRHVGGSPNAYRGVLPPHLFPQWMVPLQSACLRGLPYPLTRILNGGGRFVLQGPLPANEPLHARCALARVDDDGLRAILHLDARTGTANAPDLLQAQLQLIVPLRGGSKEQRPTKEARPSKERSRERKMPLRIPQTARAVDQFRLTPAFARRYAALSGDVNPIHWLPTAARAAGFRHVILHGYASMALAYEALGRSVFAGRATSMEGFSFRFTKPLVLPAKPSLYVDRETGAYFVGNGVGTQPFLHGHFRDVNLTAT